MNLRRWSVVLFIVLALIPKRAMAQPSATDRATARALALEAIQALEKQDFSGALERFRRADALFHAPTLTLGQARACVGLGRLVEAREIYNRTMQEGLLPNASQAFIDAVQDATKERDALSLRIPTLIVNITGAKDPSVTIDGSAIPSASLGVKRPIDPGKHVIRSTAPGYVAVEATVMSVEGKSETISLDMRALPPTPTVPKVESTAPGPGAKAAPASVRAGAPPAGTLPTPLRGGKEDPKSSTRTILTATAFGVGGVGMILGVTTGILAASMHRDLEVACPGGTCPPETFSKLDRYQLMGALSTTGFVLGGAGIVAGVVIALVPAKSSARQIQSLTPFVGPGFAGIRGAF